MSKEVVQHKGRVGRGLATGSGGWCLSESVSPDRELLASEALEAYLSLVAARIKPRPGLFDSVTKVLPKGLDASVARQVLRSVLPAGYVVRLLGSDGRFASRFVEGVQLFHQLGETLRKSRDEFPVGYESWVSETVGEYYEGDDSVTRTSVQVPFRSPAGLKIAMHTVSAVASGYLKMDYWNWFDEEEESDNEEIGIRTKVSRKVLPRMPETPKPKPAASVGTEVFPWQYDANPADAKVKRARRRGMSWTANGEGRMAITTLVRALDRDEMGTSVANPVVGAPDYAGKVAYALPLDSEDDMIPVKSAGGGKILLVSEGVHACFMSGMNMKPDDVVDVIKHVVEIRGVERLAKSTLFDNWSPAWLCWFNSMGDVDTFERLKAKGLHSNAVKLLGLLYDRFKAEVMSVALSSNLYKDKLGTFFRAKPSVTRFVSAVRKGKLPIAQSEVFVERVLRIKDAYDSAVMSMETTGVFAPALVTGAQRRLPLRDKQRKMEVIDEDVISRDKSAVIADDMGRVDWRR